MVHAKLYLYYYIYIYECLCAQRYSRTEVVITVTEGPVPGFEREKKRMLSRETWDNTLDSGWNTHILPCLFESDF